MIRKILFIFVIVSICCSGNAFADYFQFIHANGGAYFSYAPISINGNNYYTDQFGRATISLPNGSYSGSISFSGRQHLITISINGSSQLKVVSVNN